MKISRRNFLTGSGMAIAATTLAGIRDPEQNTNNSSFDFQDWSVVREQFDLDPAYIHLSCFFIVSHPRPVREAIERFRKQIDRNPCLTVEHALFGSAVTMTDKVKASAAKYLEAKPQQFAITMNTTTGLALVYQGLHFQEGQEIVTTTHDHISHYEAIRLAARKGGATVKRISLFDSYDSITEDGIISRLMGAVTDNTRAVGITWVHSSSGLKLPIRKIANEIQELNRNRDQSDRILLVVDGVHGIGVENETVDSLGMDFFAAGTHKWIFGPRGTGILWAKSQNWAQLQATIPSFDTTELFDAFIQGEDPPPPTRASWITPGGFHAYEHQWALPEAFEFHLNIGKQRIEKRTHQLNTICKEGLASIRGINLKTPMDTKLSSGIICFEVDGKTPQQVADFLVSKNILASTSPYVPSFVRLAPAILNTEEEIETTLKVLRSYARS